MLQGFRNSVAYHIRLFPGCINENSYAALSDVHVHHIAQKTLDAVVGHVHHYVEIDIQDPDSVLQIDRIFLFWVRQAGCGNRRCMPLTESDAS